MLNTSLVPIWNQMKTPPHPTPYQPAHQSINLLCSILILYYHLIKHKQDEDSCCTDIYRVYLYVLLIIFVSRSQLPHGLRRGSAAARLLGLRVRIPPVGMDVCLL